MNQNVLYLDMSWTSSRYSPPRRTHLSQRCPHFWKQSWIVFCELLSCICLNLLSKVILEAGQNSQWHNLGSDECGLVPSENAKKVQPRSSKPRRSSEWDGSQGTEVGDWEDTDVWSSLCPYYKRPLMGSAIKNEKWTNECNAYVKICDLGN